MTTKKQAKILTNTKNKCDFIKGVSDALEGIYDKFYRYNRNDDGAEYDHGIRWAIENVSGVEITTFIECNK